MARMSFETVCDAAPKQAQYLIQSAGSLGFTSFRKKLGMDTEQDSPNRGGRKQPRVPNTNVRSFEVTCRTCKQNSMPNDKLDTCRKMTGHVSSLICVRRGLSL